MVRSVIWYLVLELPQQIWERAGGRESAFSLQYTGQGTEKASLHSDDVKRRTGSCNCLSTRWGGVGVVA